MELHHLWLFHKVAKNLSFTKAARELYLSQPTVSVQINKLEKAIGLKLFEKNGKNLCLTQCGQLVHSYTKNIFSLIAEMESEINLLKGEISGRLSIGASNTPGIYIIPRIIGKFKEKYPGIKTDLRIGGTFDVEKMIIVDQVDFAVIGGKVKLPKTFIVEKIIDDSMVMITSPRNPLARFEFVEPKMLADQPFITHESTSNLYNAMKHIYKNDLRVPMNIFMALGSVDSIKHAVMADLGISIIPMSAAKQDIDLGLLNVVKILNCNWKYAYSFVYHKDRNLAVPARMMIKIIKDTIGDIVTGMQ